jgi:DNA-binding MarR family transcriptional regulator
MNARAKSNDSICNCLALRQASRTITAAYDQALAGTGLRVTQFSILFKLFHLGPMTVKQIARELVMDRTTLTRNLKPLERDELVQSAPSALDRRERVIELSPAGKDKVKAAVPLWRKAQQDFEARFGTARASDLREVLRAVVATGTVDPDTEED